MASFGEESSYTSSDSERTLSYPAIDEIPPAVIEAEDDEITSMSSMGNLQDPKIVSPGQLVFDVAPLRMVPMMGVQEAATPLREQKARTPKIKYEAPIPQWMKEIKTYKEGDWRVFYTLRDDGHRDWESPYKLSGGSKGPSQQLHFNLANAYLHTKHIYSHKDYRRKFRSKCEVELFLDPEGTTNTFKRRKLQRKRIDNPDGQGADTRCTRGRRAASSTGGTRAARSTRGTNVFVNPSNSAGP
ncbi:hypothetical protein ACP70R_011967 [Stipagrostis hirtigluma subsp. patula]